MTQTTTRAAQHESLYRARRTPALVDVPEAIFFMIDGAGDPNAAARFGGCIQALYSAAYTLKFSLKKAGITTSRVAPLEGLFTGNSAQAFTGSKDEWSWTLMIRVPDEASPEAIADALAVAAAKKPEAPVGELRVERFDEGRSAQVMHLGPYAEEQPTIEALHAFIAEQGYRPRGRHHEIYLGDPRRADPAKLKTLIRQPVVAA
jgi:hypothetical protein